MNARDALGRALFGVCALAVAGCGPANRGDAAAAAASATPMSASAPTGDAGLVASATSAAPPMIAKDAAVVSISSAGSVRTVRNGSNGFTCMADDPATPGPDPMCADANAMAWLMAMEAGKPPPEGKTGLIYMMQGGVDASNLDPSATKPTAGADWIRTGPHIMIVGDPSILASYPGGLKPDTSRPYVMYGGTPYAHLMAPVG